MVGHGNKQLQQSLVKTCLSPEQLELKEEAMVMCTKNNFEAGYVNGTLGRVVAFDHEGMPVIETADKRRLTIKPTSWEVAEEGKVLASVEQIPLRLAWAITVHKSQGMSLDAAEMDLSRAFVFGQGYVALSRVRSLMGLKMLGMSPTALRVDPKVVSYDEHFRKESDAAAHAFEQMEAAEITAMHGAFVAARGGTLPTGEIEVKTKGFERTQKESTYELTKQLLLEKKSVSAMAKERKMSPTTIWTHLEKLAAEGGVDIHALTHLEPENWDAVYQRITEAIAEHGSERLKPIFEYCQEEYDYDLIRLGRMEYLLTN